MKSRITEEATLREGGGYTPPHIVAKAKQMLTFLMLDGYETFEAFDILSEAMVMHVTMFSPSQEVARENLNADHAAMVESVDANWPNAEEIRSAFIRETDIISNKPGMAELIAKARTQRVLERFISSLLNGAQPTGDAPAPASADAGGIDAGEIKEC